MDYQNAQIYLAVLFIFSFWTNKRHRQLLSPFKCCIKQSRHKTNLKESYPNVHHSRNSIDINANPLSTSPNIGSLRELSTVVPKRHCELPPVPDAAVVSTTTRSPKWPTSSSSEIDPTWHRGVQFVDSDTRPYSFCGPPSDSDQVYSSVGGNQNANASRRTSGVASATAKEDSNSRRKRSNSEPEQQLRVEVSKSTQRKAWEELSPDGNLGNETGEDSYSGSALPYYSTIPPDCAQKIENTERRSSPFYQDEPILLEDSTKFAVYAKIRGNKDSEASLSNRLSGKESDVYNHATRGYPYHAVDNSSKVKSSSPFTIGPVIPLRTYRKSEVDRLLGQHRIFPKDSNKRQASYDVNASSSSGRNSDFISGRQRISDSHYAPGVRPTPITSSRNENSSTSRQFLPSNIAPVNLSTSEFSGEYASLTGEKKEAKYTNITVRESIASLRARNALPPFLSDPRYRPLDLLPTTSSANSSRLSHTMHDAVYEGVYWYPEEPTVASSNVNDSEYGPTGVSRYFLSRTTSDSASEQIDGSSDAYTEIPDLPHAFITNRRLLLHSSTNAPVPFVCFSEDVPKFSKTHFVPPQSSFTPINTGLPPSPLVAAGKSEDSLKQMFLEMQAFHYVDSESDLSRSETPSIFSSSYNPSMSADPCIAISNVTHCVSFPLLSTSVLTPSSNSIPISDPTTSKMVVSTMTPLMECSVEESRASRSTEHSLCYSKDETDLFCSPSSVRSIVQCTHSISDVPPFNHRYENWNCAEDWDPSSSIAEI